MIGNSNDQTNFPHKLLLTDTQASKIRKVLFLYCLNCLKVSKMIQSGGFLTDLFGITSGLDNFVNFLFKVLESYSKELSNMDTKKYKNNNSNLYLHVELNMIGKKIK